MKVCVTAFQDRLLERTGRSSGVAGLDETPSSKVVEAELDDDYCQRLEAYADVDFYAMGLISEALARINREAQEHLGDARVSVSCSLMMPLPGDLVDALLDGLGVGRKGQFKDVEGRVISSMGDEVYGVELVDEAGLVEIVCRMEMRG